MVPIITLCTDFGTRDGYVAAMKGVVLAITPEVQLVDITHEISRHAVLEAAFVLDSCARFFPDGTIHLVVVDPGVGSQRRAVAVRTERQFFVAPDNGVLSLVLRHEPFREAVSLTERQFWRTTVPSATFYGRDLFAPAAAHLAQSVELARLGKRAEDLVGLPLPPIERGGDGSIRGHVLHVDCFGNVISDVPASLLAGTRQWSVRLRAIEIAGLSPCYGAVERGQLLALIGSHGYLEIAVREGNAAAHLGAQVGDSIQLMTRA